MGNFFKDLVYSKEDTLAFPSGIPGFESSRKFVIVTVPEYTPFEWMVCVDRTQLKFAIINPLIFEPTYSPSLHKEQLLDLKIEKPEDILMYTIVTVKDNPLESTANLVGPLIINRVKRIGKQIIVDDSQYTTREPIIRKK